MSLTNSNLYFISAKFLEYISLNNSWEGSKQEKRQSLYQNKHRRQQVIKDPKFWKEIYQI